MILSRWNNGNSITKEFCVMAASFFKSLNFGATMNQILPILRDRSFCSELNIELKSENPSPTGVWFRFHHGVSFTSWGEKITITLTPLSPNMTRVDVHSECGLPTQVIDWGKNEQNACNVLECIERRLAQQFVPNNVPNYLPNAVPNAIPQQPMQGSMKFCVHCGRQIAPDSNFCPFCGGRQP